MARACVSREEGSICSRTVPHDWRVLNFELFVGAQGRKAWVQGFVAPIFQRGMATFNRDKVCLPHHMNISIKPEEISVLFGVCFMFIFF